MRPLRENDLTKKRPVSTVRLPLKAETETIGVKQEELLHAVWRNFGLFHVDSLGTQVRVDSINVGSSEEKPGVAVRSRTAWVSRAQTCHTISTESTKPPFFYPHFPGTASG
jgi:hypothetical protein